MAIPIVNRNFKSFRRPAITEFGYVGRKCIDVADELLFSDSII